jgi:hypothetical protein
MSCIGAADITPCRIARTGLDIIMAAADRADRAAAASTEPILAGANSRESYFEQGEAPLAAPVMISKASFAEA